MTVRRGWTGLLHGSHSLPREREALGFPLLLTFSHCFVSNLDLASTCGFCKFINTFRVEGNWLNWKTHTAAVCKTSYRLLRLR